MTLTISVRTTSVIGTPHEEAAIVLVRELGLDKAVVDKLPLFLFTTPGFPEGISSRQRVLRYIAAQ